MRVIDLSGPLEAGMWTYDPSFPAFEATPVKSVTDDGFAVHRVTLSTHLGTHTDAPGHLWPSGGTLDDLPLESFVGWATVLRVGPCGPLEPIDADRLKATGSRPNRGDAALIGTGWGARWSEPEYPASHPFLTESAAEWLVEAGVRCVGMDTAGLMDARIDLNPAAADASPVVDAILLQAGVPYIAALRNVEAIEESRPLFVAMPLKLTGMDGAPVRAVAIEGLGAVK